MKSIQISFSTLFIICLICCNSTNRNSDPLSPDQHYKWEIKSDGNVRIEKLYRDSLLLETNYYSNDKLDSFRMIDHLDYPPQGVFMRFPDSVSVDSIFSIYVHNYHDLDSFRIVFWLAIERGCKYEYRVYRDSSLIWERQVQFEPAIEFKQSFGNANDTVKHTYYMEKVTFRVKSDHRSNRRRFLEVKNRKLKYHWEN